MRFARYGIVALTGLVSSAVAQTFTDCNPLNRTDCPLDTALGIGNYTIDFTQNIMTTRVWNTTAGTITYGDEGADFTINARGDAPTVQTNFYIFFGQVEVIMKTSPGVGIVSSIVLESNDLDEVDWEWIGGNNSYAETNYFGKGNTTSYDRAIWYPVNDPQGNFHNYTTDWSAEKIDWYIDGALVRTLHYADANGGNNFPQTPCNVRLGIWAGGDEKNDPGVIEWAGGKTDYGAGPYTMTVRSVRISDASNATQYKYGDTSGSYKSIQLLKDASPIKLDGANSQSTAQSLSQKWNGLSHTAQIGIIAGVASFVVICMAVFAVCCIKQRRIGKREKLLEDAKFEKNANELLAYRAEMTRQRNEKLAMMSPGGLSPASTAVNSYNASPNPMKSPNPGYGYANSNYAPSTYSNTTYAQSMHSFGGRGYQKF